MSACTHCGAAVPSGARFCPACAAPVEHATEPSEERKLATVLFADLVGSTALGRLAGPGAHRALLDRFYDAMAAEIEQRRRDGREVRRRRRDGGVRRARRARGPRRARAARGAGDAATAARAVRRAPCPAHRRQHRRGRRRPAREGSSFVTGDAVNVAAGSSRPPARRDPRRRAHGRGRPRRLRARTSRQTVEAKGKPAASPAAARARALADAPARRRRPATRRSSAATRARAAARPIVPHVSSSAASRSWSRSSATPGVGKTRLVRELWEWLAEQQPQPLRRTGRCLSYGQRHHLLAAGRGAAGALRHPRGRSARGRLRSPAGERPILGLTLGLDAAARRSTRSSRASACTTRGSHSSTSSSHERPAVVLIEDVHWAEDDLLDLLDGAASARSTGRCCCSPRRGPSCSTAARLGRRGPQQRRRAVLEPLPASDAGKLLDELLGVRRCPPRCARLVVERAEGNPFFVEELLSRP